MLNRHICYMMAFCEAGFLPKQNQVSSGGTGFSLLIRNSFWTACYYLWPLDVWIDLQALGPGHCVGHVWRRSWPLCVRQGPQISCTPPSLLTHTHTLRFPPPQLACPTHYLSPLNKSLQNTDVLQDFRNYRTDVCFGPRQMQKAVPQFTPQACLHSAHISSIWNMSIQIQYWPNNKRYSQLKLSQRFAETTMLQTIQ